jgi:hypothetical protein
MELVGAVHELRPFVLKSLNDRSIRLTGDILANKVIVAYQEALVPRTFYLTLRLVKLFQNAGKIYIPVHLVILLIRIRRVSTYSNIVRLLVRTGRELMHSTIFTSIYAMSLPLSYCYGHVIQNTLELTDLGMLISFVCSLAILLEDKRRWKDISLYVGSQWIESMLISLKKQKKISKELNKWQVNCFDHRTLSCSRYLWLLLHTRTFLLINRSMQNRKVDN